jgi:hypothetical protein
MEIHVDMRLSGDGFPTEEERAEIERVVELLDDPGFGEIVDQGSGRGHADVYLVVPDEQAQRAVRAIRALIKDHGISLPAKIRKTNTKPGQYAYSDLPSPGDTFLFDLPHSRLGLCRVLRRATSEELKRKGAPSLLVATSAWTGTEPPDLADDALRDILVLTHHNHDGCQDVSWVFEPPPPEYRLTGCIAPSADEETMPCNVLGGWSFALQAEEQWTWDNDPEDR